VSPENVKIIWINGAFGVGKSQTAYELHNRVSDSFIYDPEILGGFLHKNVPKELRQADYQDFTQWRKYNYELLRWFAENYHGVIIVPMTITDIEYYNEIIGKLSSDGVMIKHFILTAPKKTIRRRLRKRLELTDRWAVLQIDRCLNAFSDVKMLNGIEINTEGVPIRRCAEIIASICELELNDAKRGFLARLLTQIRLIRRF
jgi:hypothetical protein